MQVNVNYVQMLMNALQTTETVIKTAIISLRVTGVPVIKATICKATTKHVQVTISTKTVN